MLNTTEHCWTVLNTSDTVRTELDTHGHFDTTGPRWTADGQCRTLVDTVRIRLDTHRHQLDIEWTGPDTVGWRDTAEY